MKLAIQANQWNLSEPIFGAQLCCDDKKYRVPLNQIY
jgi:hypothetical protein